MKTLPLKAAQGILLTQFARPAGVNESTTDTAGLLKGSISQPKQLRGESLVKYTARCSQIKTHSVYLLLSKLSARCALYISTSFCSAQGAEAFFVQHCTMNQRPHASHSRDQCSPECSISILFLGGFTHRETLSSHKYIYNTDNAWKMNWALGGHWCRFQKVSIAVQWDEHLAFRHLWDGVKCGEEQDKMKWEIYKCKHTAWKMRKCSTMRNMLKYW